jgi:hypothetical protein
MVVAVTACIAIQRRSPMTSLKDTPENRIKLGRTVAELTQEKPWKHRYANPNTNWCDKCNSYIFKDLIHPCPVPDPITIDDSDECMGLAVRMFRELAAESNSGMAVQTAILKVSGKQNTVLQTDWLVFEASAFEIFQIIVEAKQKT